jgi:hypothetical protein
MLTRGSLEPCSPPHLRCLQSCPIKDVQTCIVAAVNICLDLQLTCKHHSAKTARMRFKTFGDLDAPEWILAQIVTMFAIYAFVLHFFYETQQNVCRAKLSSIRFKMLCTQVIACMVDGCSIDHEKIGKMTKDASFDNSDTKAVLAAINHMFRSAARFDCDEEVFSNEIGQLGLPKEHVDAMVRCFKEKKIALRGALREDMISAPLLSGVDWRASVVLASSDPSADKTPVRPLLTHLMLHSFHALVLHFLCMNFFSQLTGWCGAFALGFK